MKKILIISLLFLSLFGFTSCEQEEIKTYSGTNSIYFSPAVVPYFTANVTRVLTDSTGFSFSFDSPETEGRVFKIPIAVQGKASNTDRKVKVSIDPLSTAVNGTHFSIPDNIIIPAGKEVDTIAITVYRTPDMKDKSFLLILNLEENEFFNTNMKTKVTNVLTQKTMSFITFKLTFDDKLSQPKGWIVLNFGVFTAKKFYLMCELMHLDPMIFTQVPGSAGLSPGEMQYYRNFMKRYLEDQKASGNTIYEDDGTEMIFP